ncbi:hypothetical protein, partial [Bacteroides fragilis]|uniref:hypothetical protein n=1 Tax=Bacteroides fragilis TaxID=817 RepID=UPI0022A9F8F4
NPCQFSGAERWVKEAVWGGGWGNFFKKPPPLFLPAGISGFASARPRIFFVPHAGESLFLV